MTALRNISIVNGICVQYDAISASVRDDAMAFSEQRGYRTRIYTYRNEYPELDGVVVGNAADIIFDEHFLASELIIYHFGVYCDLFNSIYVGNGVGLKTVRYHNITPKKWLPRSDWPTIDRSLAQLHNLRAADRIWPVSQLNREDLLETGIVPEQDIEVIPLIVGDGRRKASFLDKETGVLRVVFLGRFVQSKGLTDLLRAVATLRDITTQAISVRLLGNPRFSDSAYIAELRRLMIELRLEDIVTMVGEVTDTDLAVEFARAHVLALPSYHEGFCKPVVEAMSFGCIPVTYNSGNLRYVARQHSVLVRPGDIEGLVKGIAGVGNTVAALRKRGAVTPVFVEAGKMPLAAYEAGVDAVIDSYGFITVSQQLVEAGENLISRKKAHNS